MTDLVRKAKQIEFLIDALPAPEPDASQAARLAQIEADLQSANEDYTKAVARARTFLPSLHSAYIELTRRK